jgi:hypothetical protein
MHNAGLTTAKPRSEDSNSPQKSPGPLLRILALIAFVIWSPACAIMKNEAVREAQVDFQEGKYEAVLQRLSGQNAQAGANPAVSAQIGFLQGLSYDGLNQADKARRAFQSVSDHYPDTDCGFMAKQLLNCEPLDLGSPVVEASWRQAVDTFYNVPVRGSTAFVEGAAISGNGRVVLGRQILRPQFIFSSKPSFLNLYRWESKGNASQIASLILPGSTLERNSYWIFNQPLQISDDGSVVAGTLLDTNLMLSDNSGQAESVFRWTAAGGLEDLGKESNFRSTEACSAVTFAGARKVGLRISGICICRRIPCCPCPAGFQMTAG